MSERQQTFAAAAIQILTLKKVGRQKVASGLVKLLFLSLAVVGISPVTLVTPAEAAGSWSALANQPTANANWTSIATSKDGSIILAAETSSVTSTTGYLWLSTNSGTTWNSVASAGKWNSVAMNDSGTVLMATQSNGLLYKSIDSGATWSSPTYFCTSPTQTFTCTGTGNVASTNQTYTSIAVSSAGDKAVATIATSGIRNYYYTSNSGAAWGYAGRSSSSGYIPSFADISGDGLIAYLAFSSSTNRIYTGSASSSIWASTYGTGEPTQAWSRVSTNQNGSQVLAAGSVGIAGVISYSSNSGSTWTTATSGLPGSAKWSSVVLSRNSGFAVAVAMGGFVYSSSDYGHTWTAETSSNQNWISSAISSDGSKQYAVVKGGSIYKRSTSAGAPTISSQPVSLNKTESQTATFSVTATSPDGGTLSYQWKKNGSAIDSSTNSSAATSSLTLTNITQASDSATYTVVITNTLSGTSSSTTSNGAILTISSALTRTPLSLTSTAVESATAKIAYSLALSGYVAGGKSPYTYSIVSGTLESYLKLDTSTGTISGTPQATETDTMVIRVTDGNSATLDLAFSIKIKGGSSTPLSTPTGLSIVRGAETATVTWGAVTNATSYNWIIYKGPDSSGAPLSSGSVNSPTVSYAFTSLSPGETYTVTIQAVPTNASYAPSAKASISTTLLSKALIVPSFTIDTTTSYSSIKLTYAAGVLASSYSAIIYDSSSVLLKIYTNIDSQTVLGSDLPLAPGTPYKVVLTAVGDSAHYTSASSSQISFTTSKKTLTPPTFTVTAESATAISATFDTETGASYTLSVWDSTGAYLIVSTTLYKPGAVFSNSSLAALTDYFVTIQAVTTDATKFVSSATPSGTDATAKAVTTKPVVPTMISAAGTSGVRKSITIHWNAGSGTSAWPVTGYQVNVYSDSGTPITFHTVGLVTWDTFTATDITDMSDGTTYRVTVQTITDGGTSLESSPYLTATTMAATGAPTILTQPVATKTNTYGSAETFTVSATSPDSGTLSYQWRKNGTNISGAISSTYVINSLALADAGTYSVIVTNTLAGTSQSTTSTNSTLTVNPRSIILTPISVSKVYGSSNPTLSGFTISGSLAGSDTITAITETTTAGTLSDVGSYSIYGSVAVGSAASANYSISFLPGTLSITQKALSTTTTPSIASRVYAPGSRIAGSITLGTITGFVGTDTASVTITPSASDYDTATVGIRTSTVSYVLTGTKGGNYTLANSTGISGVITKASPAYSPAAAWAPSGIRMSTVLGPTQLTPKATDWGMAGTLAFSPDSGTTLSGGLGQTLRVVFTPTDSINYTTDTQTALIDVSSAVKPSAPISPVLASVGGSAGTLLLTWGVPADNGDSAIIRYEYRIARADLLSWPSSWSSTVSTETSTTISGLTNGKSYLAQVRAINGVGESAFTQTAVSASPSGEAPQLQGAPTLNAATVDTTLGSKVTLSFTAPSILGTPSVNAFLNYQYSTDGGTTWRSTSDTSTTIVVTGLTNGSSYTFKVRVVNAAGAGASSGSLSAIPRKKPEVVTSVGLTAGTSRLVVVFTPPTDNGGSALTYKYKIRKSTDSTYSGDWLTISSLSDSGTAKTFTITKDASNNNIANGITYYVKIQGSNTWFTSDDSSEVSVNATVAQAPVIDTISADSGFTSGRSFTIGVGAHAVGSETLSYRWYKSTDTATTLSTSASYSVPSATTANAGDYFVIVTSTLASNGTTAQVTNSDPITITINGPPTISNKSSIPGATQGNTYSFTLTASGTGPITWPVVSSTLLPKGLTFTNSGANAGRISGTVDSAAVTTVVSMTLTDAVGVTNTETFTITVSSPLTIATRSLGAATKGVYYYSALAATGGATPYTWSVTGSTPLPDGLNIYNDTSTGISYIADTATAGATTKTFTLKVRDANGVEKTTSFTISIAAQVPGTPVLTSLETTTAGTLIARWTRPTSNYSFITGYSITYTAVSDSGESSEDKGSKTYTVTADDTNTAFSYTLTTLAKGRTYAITVNAYSSAASGTSSNSLSKKVGTRPSAPKSPTITQTGSGMQVRWNKSDDDGGDSDGVNYETYCWDTAGGDPFKIVFSSREHGDSEHGDANQERGVASGFTQGHSYKCHVRTTNAYGTSDWSPDSGEAKYTTVPSTPHIDNATAVGTASGKVNVTWSKVLPANNGGETITSYTVSGNKNGDGNEDHKKGCTVTASADKDTSGYSCQLSGLPSKGQMVVYLYANNKNGASTPDSMTVYVAGKTQTLTYSPISPKSVNDADFPVIASINSGQKISLLIGQGTSSSVCEKSSKGQIHLKRAGTCIVVISQNGKASSGDENKNDKEDNGNGDHNNNCPDSGRDDSHPTCDDGQNHGDDTEWEAITPVTLTFLVTDIAPLAPLSVTPKAGNGQLAISWAPASGNAGKADSYTVEVRVNGSDTPTVWTNVGTAPKTVTDTNTVVTGLTNGTKYQVRVRSINSGGNSPYTVATGYYIPMTIPDSPTITSVDGFDETSTAVIKWTRPSNNGGSEITGYKVTGTSTGTPGSWTCSTGADSATANYQCSIGGLKNKYTYSFTVIATNANGNSAPSNAMGTTLNGLSQVITITDTPTATGWTVGTTDPIINAKATSGLQVVYSTSTSGVCTVSNTAPSFGAVHFIGSGDCRIAMDQNGEGSKYSAAATRNLTLSVDPATPSAPILKSVTSVATGLSIVWDPPTRAGGGTLVESVTATGGGQTFNCQPASGVHTCILVGDGGGISRGITYSVYVTASNAAGTSDPSNTLTGVWVTVPTVPLNVTAATDPTDGRAIKLTWNKSSSNGGSVILRYEATASASGLPDKLCSVTRTDALDSATAYTCTITGARAGATYTVSFVAVNAVGKSPSASATALQIGLSQTITVQPIGNMVFGDPDTQTVASVTSAQPLTYAATSSPSSACSVNATTGAVKVLLVGTCTITVSQPGATDANESQYKAASPVSVSFNIGAVAPGEATIKSIKTDTDTARVDWTDTNFFGGASTSVYVEAKEGGALKGSCASSPAVSGGDRNCTVTGLELGHQYSITVSESNSAGITPSRSVTTKTYSPNPSAPEPISAAPGVRSGTVTWSAPSYIPDSATISYYEIIYSKNAFVDSLTATTPNGATLTTSIEGLLDNTEYEYRVRAIASTGGDTPTVTAGNYSGSAFAKTFNTPSVPLNLSGIKGYTTGAKVSLSWTTPTSNGGTPITGYVVTVSNGSATNTYTTGTATSYEAETLTAGATYTFTVAAQNAVGTGLAVTLGGVTTINVPQAAPTMNATVVKDDVADTATVTWNGITAAQNGGSPILSYKVITVRADDSSETGDVCIVKAADVDSGTAYSCTFTGVAYKTNLKYKVVATNIAGNGPASGFTNSIRLVLAQTITFPAIATQSFSAGSVNLGATTSSGATVRYTVVSTSVCSVASDTSTVATFTTAGICQIRADQDGTGTNYSAADSATATFTINAVAPASITLNQLTPGAGQIRATWSPRTFLGGAASAKYLLSWSRTNDFTSDNTALIDSDTSTVITGLLAKTLYYVRVKVMTPNWETGSAWSNVLSATTFDAPAAPVITSATQNAPGSVVIVWADVPETSTGGSPITGYTVEAFNANTGASVSKTCSASSTTCTIAGLSGGVYHQFRATAYNAVGSATSGLYPALPGIRPGASQTITASNYTVLHTAAKFKLDAAASSGLPLTYAKYGTEVRYDSMTAGYGVGRAVCTVDSVTGEVTVDLAGSCQIAVDQDGSIDSVTASSYLPAERRIITVTVQPTAPSVPTKVAVIPDNTKLTVSWSAPVDDGGVSVTNYDLYYWVASLGDGVDPKAQIHDANRTSSLVHVISGLTNGTKYATSIFATNLAGLQGSGS